jgi:hypothetical protein
MLPVFLKKNSHPTSPTPKNPQAGGSNDVGSAALMEAGIDLGFTALMAAAFSGGQHRDRASRLQKGLYRGIVGLLKKNLSPNFPAATTWGLRAHGGRH